MKFATSPVLALRLPVWRARLLLVVFFGAFAALAARAAYLQGWNNEFLQAKGESRYSRVMEIPATRGRIVDRRGEPLAISTPVKSLWAIPGEVRFEGDQLARLAALLEMPPGDVVKRIDGAERDFVFIKRQVPPETAERVAELHISGLFQNREYRSYYPGGEVMAHVLGFTGADDAGQEGIELAFQQRLAGRPGSRRVIRDRVGQIVEDLESIRAAEDGQDLVLSLDAKIQTLAFSQLKAAISQHRAQAGGILVLDVTTGEVLALANLPSYNPNNRARLAGSQLRNRVLTDTFEPGSTMKPFTVALALESGMMRADTVIQTAPGRFVIGRATISDAHPLGALTLAQVIQKSSNVGAAKIALALEREEMWALFSKAGFGTAPEVPFPGAVPGKLRPYKIWRPIEQATMAYGYGVSVSLFQLARAYSIFARDGELLPASFLKTAGPVAGRPVISAETARTVRAMLEAAAGPDGTAPKAQIMGYRVAGKTGTAHKQEGAGYARRKYRASFVGFAPVSQPRLVVAVMIDEPSNGKYFGGDVAAPVFGRVMESALRMVGVAPDAPMKPIQLPAEGEQVQESI
ncbi:MAG: cell division protein [Betaproteobacteria bacterium RIFCSPLOWO2_12_FULL_66_14]|nr:MAG: cell division protein [Betaproteobacteria bacterium RIFCSPLOWO2_12_FULL_66_14]